MAHLVMAHLGPVCLECYVEEAALIKAASCAAQASYVGDALSLEPLVGPQY